MPSDRSDRVVVQFVVIVEMPNNESDMDMLLSTLPSAVEDAIPEAVNVFADIMDVEDIA